MHENNKFGKRKRTFQLMGLFLGVTLIALTWWWFRRTQPSSPSLNPPPKPTLETGFGQVGLSPVPTNSAGAPIDFGPTTAPPKFATEEVVDPLSGKKVRVAADRLLVTFQAGVSKQERQALWQSVGATREEDLGLNIFNLFFPKGTDLEKVRKKLAASSLVKYAERDAVVQEFYIPNDPLDCNAGQNCNQAPWFNLIGAPEAWEFVKNGAKIAVAIVDQGVMQNHSDLPEVTYAIPYNGAGFHGTHVAGISCALTDNSVGVAATSFNGCQLIGAQALGNNTGSGSTGDIIRAYNASVSAGAKVINMSLGGGGTSQSFQDAITSAWNKGVITVAAAGNVWSTSKLYPAAYNHVIAVAATNSDGSPASFSTHSAEWVDVAAPGVDIRSTWNNGGYNSISGTSMASPMVASLVALCWSANPGYTNQQVQDFIFQAAYGDKRYAAVGPTANFSRHGLINAKETARLCANAEPLPTPSPTPTPEESGISCFPEEWRCRDDDVADPEQKCCQCGALIAPTPPFGVPCRTNEDEGQKDGTGRTGTYRQYRWFDPDVGRVVQVPPVRAPDQPNE